MQTTKFPTEPLTHTILRAEGFSCPSCVAKIEKQVGRLDGVSAVKVHFASARIEIDHDAALAGVDDLVAAVAKAGYVARPAAF
jgi:copper ion binding protein